MKDVLSFSKHELVVRDDLPVWEKGHIVEGKFKKGLVLKLNIDEKNGQKVEQVYEVLNPKLIDKFRNFGESGTLFSWKFSVTQTENGTKKEVDVTPLAPKQGGASAPLPATVKVTVVDDAYYGREILDSDLKVYRLMAGVNELPRELAQVLLDRGVVRLIMQVNLASAL